VRDPEPRWFGPSDRSLFGWVHLPSGDTSRGAVVVCGSMGQEASFTHFTLRRVANRLAELGFVVVRFDYDGTGDSVGDFEDPDRVDAWLDSIDEAIDLARSHTAAPLALLGMRLGSLLAVGAAERRGDVHGLVLWDSPRSGSSYIREQRVRQNTSVGGADPELATFSALGLNFTSETKEELSLFNLRALPILPADVVLTAERPASHALGKASVTRAGIAPERIEAPDQDEFLIYQTLPVDTENAVVDWFDRTYQDQGFDVDPEGSGPLRTSLRVPGGTEQIVRISDVGLFGILSEPDRPCTTTSVVFVPDAFTPHVGLSRIWTETSRSWCQSGIRALRFDLSGCGDSPARPGRPGHEVKILEHIDEVNDAVKFVSPRDHTDAVLIGLCSGAYHCLESALDLGPRGIALINPILAFPSHEDPVSKRRGAIQLTRPIVSRHFGALAGRLAWMLSPRYRNDPTFQWRRMLEACYWQRAANHQLSGLPEWFWTVLNWILVVQRPEQLMRRVLARGTSVLWIGGGRDWKISTIGSRRALQRLARRSDLHLVEIEDLDHAMMRPGVKGHVITQFTAFVEEHIAPPPPATIASAANRSDLDPRRGAVARTGTELGPRRGTA
jgi:alpha-beta hydrolase superfamily lysophospholipase